MFKIMCFLFLLPLWEKVGIAQRWSVEGLEEKRTKRIGKNTHIIPLIRQLRCHLLPQGEKEEKPSIYNL